MAFDLTLSELAIGGAAIETFIIDITPCSTAPSSPAFECEKVDEYFDHEPRSVSDPIAEDCKPSKSVVHGMVSSLQTLYAAKASQDLIIASEEALLAHLHTTAVTVADVEALVPAMNRNRRILFKLATNIGLYNARHCISQPDLETMLIHIFTHDDHRYSLFSRTTAQIERFEHEAEENKLRKLTWSERQLKLQHDESLRKQNVAKLEREAYHRRESVPTRWRKPITSGFLPGGCSSIGELVTEVDGMHWSQVRKIIQVSRESSPKSNSAEVPPTSGRKRDRYSAKKQFWARTRLHNCPGLYDRNATPEVRLPCKKSDVRDVVTVADGLAEEKEKEQRDYLFAKSKSFPGHLFKKQTGGKVVVRLPPR